jgi:NADH-quinone oxidoreductase subunit L
MPNATNIALIPLLPLAAFVLLGLFGRKYLKSSAGLIGTALLLGSTVLAFYPAENDLAGLYQRDVH